MKPIFGTRGRRFKSSLPDQSFQALKAHFWLFVYSGVDEIVDGEFFRVGPPDWQDYGEITVWCQLPKIGAIFSVKHREILPKPQVGALAFSTMAACPGVGDGRFRLPRIPLTVS